MDQERVRTQTGFDDFRDEVHSQQDSPFHGFPDQPPHWQRQPPFHQQLGQFRQGGGAHYHGLDGNPDPGRGSATAPLAALRSWFPLLHAMPDEMMIATDLNTLMALNRSLEPSTQTTSDPMAQAAEV
jgi:hypothetical protein